MIDGVLNASNILMLQKYMMGRCGNQMFQYAAVRAFQLKNNLEGEVVKFDFSGIYLQRQKNGNVWCDCLRHFNVIDYKIGNISPSMMQKFLINIEKLIMKLLMIFKKNGKQYVKTLSKIEKKLQKLYNMFGLYYFSLGWCDFKNYKLAGDKLFFGYFESPKYFDCIKSIIKEEFTPKYDILAHNACLYDRIKNSESVCVSIRRGDFIEDENNKELHYICTPGYFYRCIEYIQKRITNAKFFIFSDDIEWCKCNMIFPRGTQFEKGGDPVREKLRLMYSCKHFIISNSTFSWWAQYLSDNDKKIVCAPSRRLNPDFSTKDYGIQEEGWILINPD